MIIYKSRLLISNFYSSQVSVKESNVGPTNNQAKSGVNFVNNGHADQKKEVMLVINCHVSIKFLMLVL